MAVAGNQRQFIELRADLKDSDSVGRDLRGIADFLPGQDKAGRPGKTGAAA